MKRPAAKSTTYAAALATYNRAAAKFYRIRDANLAGVGTLEQVRVAELIYVIAHEVHEAAYAREYSPTKGTKI